MELPKNTRNYLKSIYSKLLKRRFPFPVEVFKWLIVDIYRKIKYPNKLEFRKFHMYTGRRGSGKTLSLTDALTELRNKYGDSILIATNYGYTLQDFHLTHFSQIMDDYEKPIVFAIDEIQNQFDARRWAEFPSDLFEEITQSRKKQKMLISAAQYYEMVDKKIRFYSDTIIHVSPLIPNYPRIIVNKHYDRIEYERLIQSETMPIKPKIKPLRLQIRLITDETRNQYKTDEIVKKMQKEQRIPMYQKEFTPLERPYPNLVVG